MRARRNTLPTLSMPAMTQSQHQFKAAPMGDEVVHEWAGDVYDLGDETDPQDSYSSFAGLEGEEAWLDRADDGTLTGWVRDSDGTVYRYIDPEAWSIDVDQAGMRQVHLNDGSESRQGDDGAPDDGAPDEAPDEVPDEAPAAGGDLPEDAPDAEAQDPAEGEESEDVGADELTALFGEEGTEDAPDSEPAESEEPVEPADEGAAEQPAEGEEPEDEDDDEDLPFLEGKSWQGPHGPLTFRHI